MSKYFCYKSLSVQVPKWLIFWGFVLLVSACSEKDTVLPIASINTQAPALINTATPTAILALLSTETPIAPTPQPTTSPNSFAPPEPINTIHCEHEGVFWRCDDELLNIEFKIPSRWGPIPQAYLLPGGCGGYSYHYDVEKQYQFGAVGHSLDYCNPTEGSSFVGFREWQKSGFQDVEGCSLFRKAFYCEPVNPNVVIVILFPDSQSLCDPYSDTIWKPIAQIGVNLPVEQKISGVKFSTRFLSIKLEDQLFEPFGGVNFDQSVCKDTEILQQFDNLIYNLVQAIASGQVDDETNYQLKLIREFAASIRLNSP